MQCKLCVKLWNILSAGQQKQCLLLQACSHLNWSAINYGRSGLGAHHVTQTAHLCRRPCSWLVPDLWWSYSNVAGVWQSRTWAHWLQAEGHLLGSEGKGYHIDTSKSAIPSTSWREQLAIWWAVAIGCMWGQLRALCVSSVSLLQLCSWCTAIKRSTSMLIARCLLWHICIRQHKTFSILRAVLSYLHTQAPPAAVTACTRPACCLSSRICSSNRAWLVTSYIYV